MMTFPPGESLDARSGKLIDHVVVRCGVCLLRSFFSSFVLGFYFIFLTSQKQRGENHRCNEDVPIMYFTEFIAICVELYSNFIYTHNRDMGKYSQ